MSPSTGCAERVLVVHLTTACNLRCEYCFQRDKELVSLSWTSLRSALEWLLAGDRDNVRVAFTGGEPLLQFDLLRRAIAFLEDERRRGLRLTAEILTNGLLLDDETIAFVADHDVHVHLSMDGRPPAQDLRGRGTFARLDRLLTRLREDRRFFFEERLKIAVTVCRQNVPVLADSVDYLLDVGVTAIGMTPAMTADAGWTDHDTAELDRQFAAISRRGRALYEQTGRVPLELFRRSERDGAADASRTGCTIGDGHALVVDVAGRAVPCPLFSQGYHTPGNPLLDEAAACIACIGDVAGSDVAARIAACGERLHALPLFEARTRRYSSWGRCAECPYRERCFICPVSTGLIPGNTDPNRVPDFQCAFSRVSLAWRDRFPPQPSLEDVRRSLDRFWASLSGRQGQKSSVGDLTPATDAAVSSASLPKSAAPSAASSPEDTPVSA
jgi:sulfatase maturation enzyme AslB (radical SAM superfamily)